MSAELIQKKLDEKKIEKESYLTQIRSREEQIAEWKECIASVDLDIDLLTERLEKIKDE